MSIRDGLISFLLLSATAAAQPGQLSGPLAGYAYDQASFALRPVRGVPGAATLGDPLALGIAPRTGFVAPGQDLAIIVATDGSTRWYGLSGNAATEVAAAGSIATPQRVVFSPSGKAAALIAGQGVQVVTGLPSSPALAGSVTLAAALVTNVSGRHLGTGPLALSDDGVWLLAASGTELRLIAVTGGNSTALMPIGQPAIVAFAPGGHDAAVSSAGALTWIHDATGSASQQVLAGSSGQAPAVGVAFSADGGTLYAASSSGLVLRYDLAAGTSVEQSSGAAATALEPMGAFFRLNEAGAGPLWLVDPSAGSARIFFVPPAATSN